MAREKEYLVSINGQWVGNWYSLPAPHKGNFFSPTHFKELDDAKAIAKHPRICGKVEVHESWGIGPKQRKVVFSKVNPCR